MICYPLTENILENFRLLEKHRKKLSIYFALFILFSLWIIEGFFLLSLFINNNIKLEEKLETRYAWVINILENRQEYFDRIDENDTPTKIILERTLDGVTINQDGEKILWEINTDVFWENQIYNSQSAKYYSQKTNINGNNYHIVIEWENEYSSQAFFIRYSYFLLFTLPFSILFYWLWYIFVGKNFLPIKETISSLETFSGNMNHEMKTPLAEIISTLSLAQRVKWNYEKAIETSLHSSRKLSKILDSLLWIINLVDSSYKKEKLNLVSELDTIIKENEKQAQERKITIKKVYSEKNFSLSTNKEHLYMCIGNILKNAIKYSKEKWKIDIKLSNGILEIQDYGIGIESKNLKNIFNRYFRENYVKQDGYGLGLALVKKITDMHKWKIDIESKKNTGTKVTLIFSEK